MLRQELLKDTPAVAAVIGIFFVVAFCWNLFILASFIFKYHLLKEPGNIFLFNLALVDFLITISNMLISLVSESAREFVFGSTDVLRCNLCDAFGFFLIFLIAVSLHTLAALSVDRFILLAWPLKYKSIVSKRVAVIVLCVIWLICVLIALPPLFGFGQFEFNTNFGACLPRFRNDPLLSPYNFHYVLLVAIEALFPLCFLAVTNIWTYKIVSKVLKKNFRRRKTFHEGIKVEEKRETLRHQNQQQQLIKVFAALFVAHLISWTPVIVVVFIIAWVDAAKIPPQVYIFGWICYLTNPVFHPIIETFFVKDLRYQVHRVRSAMTDTLVRAGTTLYRKASKSALTLDALEEANRKLDKEESLKRKGAGHLPLHKLPEGAVCVDDQGGVPTATMEMKRCCSEPPGVHHAAPVALLERVDEETEGSEAVVDLSNQIGIELENAMFPKCGGCLGSRSNDKTISSGVGKQ